MPAVSYDYIPAQDAALRDWLQGFESAIDTEYASYGISSGQATAFTALVNAYAAALTTATTPATRTKPTVAAKDSARFAAVQNARLLAGIAQAFPAITPELLAAAGLTVRNTVPTPVPTPTTVPLLSLVSSLGSQLTISFSDETSPLEKYKPFGAIGLQVVGTYGVTPPATPDVCPPLETKGRWPLRIDAGAGNNGKTFYIYGRWITRTGKVGPWSAQLTGIVQP